MTGAIAGLTVMLFASVLGQTSWQGGLFMGGVTCVLGGGLLIWLLVSGRQPPFDPGLSRAEVRLGANIHQPVVKPDGSGDGQNMQGGRGGLSDG